MYSRLGIRTPSVGRMVRPHRFLSVRSSRFDPAATHRRSRSMWLVAAAVTLGFMWPSAGSAQSLWQNRNPHRAFMFYDTQARRAGDLLTVIINEETDVQNSESRSMGKSTDASNDFGFNIEGGGGGTGAAQDFNSSSDRKFSGNASFSSARDFSDRITVMVLDVLPNGSLVVGGRRRVIVEGDAKTLVLSGVVRPFDIKADNTIPSRYVANFEIAYEGAGAESNFTKQSWLGRLANPLWPF